MRLNLVQNLTSRRFFQAARPLNGSETIVSSSLLKFIICNLGYLLLFNIYISPINIGKPVKHVRSYTIQKSISEVRQTLTDLELYAEKHHLMRWAKKTGISPEGNAMFVIKERPYSWLPIAIKYEATVLDRGHELEYLISKIPLLKPHIKYQLKELSENKTEVTFILTIDGFALAKSTLAKKMLKAQDKLMAAINQ